MQLISLTCLSSIWITSKRIELQYSAWTQKKRLFKLYPKMTSLIFDFTNLWSFFEEKHKFVFFWSTLYMRKYFGSNHHIGTVWRQQKWSRFHFSWWMKFGIWFYSCCDQYWLFVVASTGRKGRSLWLALEQQKRFTNNYRVNRFCCSTASQRIRY